MITNHNKSCDCIWSNNVPGSRAGPGPCKRPVSYICIRIAMMYIKTMTNSWFTFRSLANAGAPQLDCIFGCVDCADDLLYYLHCDVLWYFVCSAMELDDSWVLLAGIDTVCFPDAGPTHLYTTCVMFNRYHAIRNDYATILDGCIPHHDFSEIHSKTILLARHFAIDFLC